MRRSTFETLPNVSEKRSNVQDTKFNSPFAGQA